MQRQHNLDQSISMRDLGVKSHLEALLTTVGPVAGLRVIDIGCGEGELTRAVAKLGARIAGYDPFIAATETTAYGAGSFRLATAAADAIPEPDHETDLVLFIFSLHHVPSEKLKGALAEARRLLHRRAGFTSRSLWRKARINTLWSCSMTKPRCERPLRMRLFVSRGRISLRNKF